GQVVTLQVVICVQTKESALEGIAPLCGNHVHYGAVGSALGRDTAGLEHHFLNDGHVRGPTLLQGRHLDRHPINVHVGAALAMERGVSSTDLGVIEVGGRYVARKSSSERHDLVYPLRTGRQHVEQIM